MRTYRDVFLTEDGFARNEDGFEFRKAARVSKKKLVCGIGINDFPNQIGGREGGTWKPYLMWQNMLCRAYDPKEHERHPTYIGTEVDPSWHRFSGFLEWLWTQPYHAADFQLDKDIVGRGKFYGPEDCVLVPQWVNSLTVDRGAARGELPLGVSKKGNRFCAEVKLGDGKSRIRKTFGCVSKAVEFYNETKMDYVDLCKGEFDEIDARIYHGIIRILDQRAS